MHQLEVTYENIPVPGSPFRVSAVPGCDSSRVRAYGPGLESATTNEPTSFTIETKGAGQGSLGLAIEGPSEAKMICKDNQDGTCIMEYLPVRNQIKYILEICIFLFSFFQRQKLVNMI
jgi:filamin